jgi:hypothetical protein
VQEHPDAPEARARLVAARELAESLEPGLEPRLLIDDATQEAITRLLGLHGQLALLDSEGGIFAIIAGRYTNGILNLEVFLKAYDGDAIRVDRITRDPDRAEHPLLTIGLTVQPQVLEGLAARPEFRGRGLIARFAFVIPASLVGRRNPRSTPTPEPVADQYHQSLLDLGTRLLECDEPLTLSLDDAAREALLDYRGRLEALIGPGGDLESIEDFVNKHPGRVARIAALLTLLEDPALTNTAAPPISAATIDNAIRIGDYLIDHAQAAFNLMATEQTSSDAQLILNWMQSTHRRTFTARDAFASNRGLKRMNRVEAALKLLVAHGYAREARLPGTSKTSGRPRSPIYDVNPDL